MGTYFNPGNRSFLKDSGSRIYIDKTCLINELNNLIFSADNCVALSHARRFGKSQAAGMIDAYYSYGSDSKELFSKFEIAKNPDFEKHLNKYNVIHIDVSSVADYYKDGLVDAILDRLKGELKEEIESELNLNQAIQFILNDVYKITNRPFVIIIDEWDCVVRNHDDREDLVHEYLQFLHSLFKSEESKSYLALAYITGILPIKRIRNESALNNFREYTMINSKKLAKYFGFTEEEVRVLCKKYNMEFESVKKWYDGYLINGYHMYNPNSVYQSMIDESLESYWKNTSSFETINNMINKNYTGIKDDILTMLEGGYVRVNTDTFKNDFSTISSKDEALTGLIHLGYLAYDNDKKKAFIPNYEVSKAFQAAMSDKACWGKVSDMIATCDELLDVTIEMDTERVAELLELSHETYTSILKYNDENSLACAITMAYFTAPAYYTIVRELPSGKGFADFAFIPRKEANGRPAMIVELKWNESAETAIKQIKDKRYSGALAGYEDEMLLVGVSYNKDSAEKKHECVIEKV